MAETGNQFVDSKTVAVAGTPEALTSREIACSSIFLLPKPGNTGDVLLVDATTASKVFIIPLSGLTLPVQNPALVQIDVSVGGEGLDWLAV